MISTLEEESFRDNELEPRVRGREKLTYLIRRSILHLRAVGQSAPFPQYNRTSVP
jgi:hypothetical protein